MIYLIKPSWQEPEDENVIKSPRAGKFTQRLGKIPALFLPGHQEFFGDIEKRRAIDSPIPVITSDGSFSVTQVHDTNIMIYH
jgi:hypothetical protein